MLPTSQNRSVLIGSTGSGKTQLATWLLSTRDWDIRPWVIFNTKLDELLGSLGARRISIHEKPPRNPGLYIVEPAPTEGDAVTRFLYECWAQENIGLFFDEAYAIPARDAGLTFVLTQGRSKNIEVISCCQRPVHLHKNFMTEADFIAVMRLNNRADIKNVQDYMSVDLRGRLAPYHAHWYDVTKDRAVIFSPCPSREEIIKSFRNRLRNRPKVI